MSTLLKPSVSLVLHDFCRGWIIEKMAYRMCEALREEGVSAEVNAQPSANYAVNHFMMFHYAEPHPGTLNTMFITHVDDALKVDMIRKFVANGVRAGICQSAMTVKQLIDEKIASDRLTYIVPAHDCAVVPRRMVVGITSNNPVDGRKRGWLLTRLAAELPLQDFEFRIFGEGWDDVGRQLMSAGAKVAIRERLDFDADYLAIRSEVQNFDYYFYPGLDEGSFGTFDALAAGVKTIITKQGFHLDIPNAITHGFWDYDELRQIFESLIAERHARVGAAQQLTWSRYARKHLEVWRSLIERDILPLGKDLGSDIGEPLPSPKKYPVKSYFSLLANSYRRDMTLRYWLPGPYQNYLDARRNLGRVIREWKGRAR